MYYGFLNPGLQIGVSVEGDCPAWIVIGGPYLRWLVLGSIVCFAVAVSYRVINRRVIRRPNYRRVAYLTRNKAVVLLGMVALISIILLIFAYIIGGNECLTAAS